MCPVELSGRGSRAQLLLTAFHFEEIRPETFHGGYAHVQYGITRRPVAGRTERHLRRGEAADQSAPEAREKGEQRGAAAGDRAALAGDARPYGASRAGVRDAGRAGAREEM